MLSQQVYFEPAGSADHRFDPIVESLLVGLLAFAPAALGAVHPWSEAVVLALSAAMGATLALKLLARPDVRFVWSWAYAPYAALVVLAGLQLMPLPEWAVGAISPEARELRRELLADLPGAAEALRWMPLTLHPEATRASVRLLAAGLIVLVVTVNVIRRVRQVRRMLAAITVIGTAVATLALAQVIGDATRIYWIIPTPSGDANAGPFVNHNHFAQLMSLSMGAALGLLMLHLDELPRHRDHSDWGALAGLARPLTTGVRVLACAVVLMGLTVPLSLSRGGMISLLIAGAVTAAVLARRRGIGGRTWIFVGLVLAVLGIVLLMQLEPVLRRATRIDDPATVQNRLELARGALEMWRSYPAAGAGLGSFEVMFPLFDQGARPFVATHAENEYVQLAAETGTPGLVALAMFVAIVAWAYVLSVRSAPSPMASAAIGLGFGLMAVAVHSAGDFGQRIPAVGMLSTVTCGLVISLAQATRRRSAITHEIAHRGRRRLRVAGAVVAAGVMALVLVDAAIAWRADTHARRAAAVARVLEPLQWRGDPAPIEEMIRHAELAAQLRPHDVGLRFALNQYRWNIAAAVPVADADRAAGADEAAVRATAARIVQDLLSHARYCPTYMPQYLRAGQLQRYVLDEPARGGALIRLAYRLGANHPDVCIEAAVVDAQDENWNEAQEKFERAIALREDYRREVINVLVTRLDRPDFAMELAGEDLAAMRHLAEVLRRSGRSAGHRQFADVVQRRADQLLLRRAEQREAPPALLAEAARLCRDRGEIELAIRLYRRALAIEFAATTWRLELAQLLLEKGLRDEALEEGRAAMRYQPGHAGAQQFVRNLALAPVTAPATSPATGPATSPARGFRFD